MATPVSTVENTNSKPIFSTQNFPPPPPYEASQATPVHAPLTPPPTYGAVAPSSYPPPLPGVLPGSRPPCQLCPPGQLCVHILSPTPTVQAVIIPRHIIAEYEARRQRVMQQHLSRVRFLKTYYRFVI